jgi:hypothetical protein
MSKEYVPIDRGEQVTVERLRHMSEPDYRVIMYQKQEVLFNHLDNQNQRLIKCEDNCHSWHGIVLKFMTGTIFGGVIVYVMILVLDHVAKGGQVP